MNTDYIMVYQMFQFGPFGDYTLIVNGLLQMDKCLRGHSQIPQQH